MTVDSAIITVVSRLYAPLLCTLHPARRGEGGVFSSTQLVSIIRPLTKFRYVYNTAKVHVHSYKTAKFMIASTVRGHLACHCMVSLHRSARRAALQLEGIHNDLAVAILKNSNIVGHEPRNISWYFLRRSGSEMTCTVGVNGDYSI